MDAGVLAATKDAAPLGEGSLKPGWGNAEGASATGGTARRVTVELPRQGPDRLELLTDVGMIDSFRVIHLFQLDERSYSGLCRVKFRDPSMHPSRMEGQIGISKVECLARLEDGASLVHIEGSPTVAWARLATLTGGAMYPALELTPENWRISVVGSNAQMRSFLADLRQLKMSYKVVAIENANLDDSAPSSPMRMLTPKQREALTAAYHIGYYDIPKRAESADVAKVLALGKSTTLEHLRKAEKRLLDSFMIGGRGLGGS